MIPIIKSEYSFKQCYSPIKDIVDYAVKQNLPSLCIADVNNTFGHFHFDKACKDAGIKPIFGVQINTLPKESKQRTCHLPWVYIAKNTDGLRELYSLVKRSYDEFYYVPRLTIKEALEVSENIEVLSPYRVDKKLLEGGTFPHISSFLGGFTYYSIKEGRTIPMLQNRYIKPDQRPIYQLLAGVTKRGDTYIQNFDQKTFSQHIWSDADYILEGGEQDAIDYSFELAKQCNSDLIKAPMIKYPKTGDLKKLCIRGAKKRGIDLSDEVYAARLDRELKLMIERDFQDYFLIVSDIINSEKSKGTLIGPGRGSSGGSLVCFLIGITEIDPIKFGLIFERFIDVTRFDLPDIDSDIPDIARGAVIKHIKKTYGDKNVAAIGTILRYKAKSAIDEFSKSLNIPKVETEEVKNAIIERSGGDARASMCIMDTLDGTEPGRKFIEKYPAMALSQYAEGHANHYGKHAAGIIIANDPLDTYCGVNSRDGIIMMEGAPAEQIGLLKVDVLGLRTLTVIGETAKLAGFKANMFYDIPLDDEKTLSMFNQPKLNGIFQFEGKTLSMVTHQMGVESFDDVCALTAIGRPGALNSGGANRYIKRRIGADVVDSVCDVYDKVTKDTYGVILYQEQTMVVLREYGALSWGDVNILRKAMSKSYGDEFFSKYKDRFVNGAVKQNYSKEQALIVWETVASMGSYGFNKSHAVAYALISYWTAYCKAHHKLEFAAASLNNAKDEESSIRLLREFVKVYGIDYIPVDPDVSDINWTIYDGKLVGGLTNMDGIGIKKAQGIVKARKTGRSFTPAILNKMLNPVTPFDILFPTEHYYGHLYNDPVSYGLTSPPTKIIDAQESGEYTIIGRVIDRDLRDRNDVQSVIKRGGEMIEKDPFYLNLFIEDDTDDIKCTIPPYLFDELEGQKIAETVKLNETYMLIKGNLRDGWRNISITALYDITDMKKECKND